MGTAPQLANNHDAMQTANNGTHTCEARWIIPHESMP